MSAACHDSGWDPTGTVDDNGKVRDFDMLIYFKKLLTKNVNCNIGEEKTILM